MFLKYLAVGLSGFLALSFVVESKFSDWIAKDIEKTRQKIAAYEREISELKLEINSATNDASIKAFAKEKNWDFVNLKKDQIVLTHNEKNNSYKVQNEKRNIVEQIMLNFTE